MHGTFYPTLLVTSPIVILQNVLLMFVKQCLQDWIFFKEKMEECCISVCFWHTCPIVIVKRLTIVDSNHFNSDFTVFILSGTDQCLYSAGRVLNIWLPLLYHCFLPRSVTSFVNTVLFAFLIKYSLIYWEYFYLLSLKIAHS